jgi:hypothetical protein
VVAYLHRLSRYLADISQHLAVSLYSDWSLICKK